MTEENLFEPPEIPEGYIPLHAVIIVASLDPDGDKSYSTHIRGTSTIGDVLSIIELAKDDILTERRENRK